MGTLQKLNPPLASGQVWSIGGTCQVLLPSPYHSNNLQKSYGINLTGLAWYDTGLI